MDGNLKVDQPSGIANAFNKFYINIGGDLASNISASDKTFSHYLAGAHERSFFLHPTNIEEVIEIIKCPR